MKKLMLAASLCIAAFVIVPAASASAAPLTGSCAITGSAKFSPNLKSATQAGIAYKFTGQANCVEAGTEVHQEGAATVEGKFKGNCAQAESEGEGTGSLVGHTITGFKFTAAGGSVAFEGDGGLAGGGFAGDAGFYLSGSPVTGGELAAFCAAHAEGVGSLGFVATAAGTLK
jgi:hypothetical protein